MTRSSKKGSNSSTMRKAASYDPLTREKSSAQGSGGVRFDDLSSPSSTDQNPPKAASDGDQAEDSSDSSGFDAGLNEEDDVFAESGADDEIFAEDGAFAQDRVFARDALSAEEVKTTVAIVEQDDDHVEEETQAETQMVYHAPTVEDLPEVDAQGIWPPTACIFVANLAQAYDDNSLEAEVTRFFNPYGRVFVKIRRDRNKMPFAFCQFTNDQHALDAERYGKGVEILGRPARTEMVKANVTFLVSKRRGNEVTEQEAFDLLNMLGRLAKVETLDGATQARLQVPKSVVVWFAMYDARRDPVKNFGNNHYFNVVEYDPVAKKIGATAPRMVSKNHDFLAQYDQDRRSVFLGNLPLDMTEAKLRPMVSGCGNVVAIQVIIKDVPGGNGIRNCFAFVEYVRPDSVDDLIREMNGMVMGPYKIKAEHKTSRKSGTPRSARQRFPPAAHERGDSSYMSPNGPPPANPQGQTPSSASQPRVYAPHERGDFNYVSPNGPPPANPRGQTPSSAAKASPAAAAAERRAEYGSRSQSKAVAGRAPNNESPASGSVPSQKGPSAASSMSTPSKSDKNALSVEHTPVSMPPCDATIAPAYPSWPMNPYQFGYQQMAWNMPQMTPQATPGMSYPGFPPYNQYPGSVPWNGVTDMYGNMLMPPPMMPSSMMPPAMMPGPAPFDGQTQTDPGDQSQAQSSSGKENEDESGKDKSAS